MSSVLMSYRQHRLMLAFLPMAFAVWFAQVTTEKVRALLGGHDVMWSEKHLVLLSGWSFVMAAGALTALAIGSAYAIWRSRPIAWVLLAVLWSAPTFAGAIHLLSQEHTAPLDLMYLLAFAVVGLMLAIAVRRLTKGTRSNAAPEPTSGI
jgi:hypothetical protein